jgi:hypothetical protein
VAGLLLGLGSWVVGVNTIGEISSPEVVKHLVETTIDSGNPILAWDRPRDVRSEQLPESCARPARAKLVLRLVQLVEEADSRVPVHGRHRLRSEEIGLLEDLAYDL